MRLFVVTANNCPTIDEFEVYKIGGDTSFFSLGNSSERAESNFTVVPGNWYNFRAEVSEDEIAFYINNEPKGTLKATGPDSGTSGGIYI